MKCISEELIQKYIDKECTLQEEISIRNHISGCAQCAETMKCHSALAIQLKQFVGLANEQEGEIPVFKKPASLNKIRPSRFKKIIYSAAAACILMLSLIPLLKEKNNVELLYTYDLEYEFDANLPISEQEMEIQIMDMEGKLISN